MELTHAEAETVNQHLARAAERERLIGEHPALCEQLAAAHERAAHYLALLTDAMLDPNRCHSRAGGMTCVLPWRHAGECKDKVEA